VTTDTRDIGYGNTYNQLHVCASLRVCDLRTSCTILYVCVQICYICRPCYI